MEKNGANAEIVDINKTTTTLEPEKSTGGGLYVPGKDRVVYVAPERKSRLGLDTLAIAKRGESQSDGAFKVPKEITTSIAAAAEDEDKSESSDVVEESGQAGTRRNAHRRYRETTSETSRAESSLTDDHHADTYGNRSTERRGSDVSASPSGYDRDDHRSERRHSRDDSRSDSREVRHRNNYDSRESYSGRDSRSRYYDHEYDRKRNRYEGSRRTPGRSDWDHGRWEWEDTPRRDGVSSSRRHQPSPSPMFVGASPDARLVSPWHTPHSSYNSPSPDRKSVV